MANVPWHVEFDWDAEETGIVEIKLSFRLRNGGVTAIVPVAQLTVLKDWTPEQKAAAVVRILRAGPFRQLLQIDYVAGSDDFKVKVRPNPPAPWIGYLEIHGFAKTDHHTGEGITGVEDDPPARRTGKMPSGIGFLVLSGEGARRGGTVGLQLGHDQLLVEVASFGRSAAEIVRELIAAFNEAYAPLGFRAVPKLPRINLFLRESPGLSIAGVPCPLGIRAGARDAGFTTEMGYVLTHKPGGRHAKTGTRHRRADRNRR